jgi:hypothetical protein
MGFEHSVTGAVVEWIEEKSIMCELFAKFGIALVLVAATGLSSVAWGQEMLARPSDKDIQTLVKTLAQDEKKFERATSSEFKRSVLRGPGGEIDVDHYLDDLSVAIDRLSKRFTGSYSASTEATEVLERSDFMDAYVRNNSSLKGANEWDVFASGLQQLASAYGTSFPLPEGAVVRRIGDGELADAATALGKFAKNFDGVLGKSTRGMDELSESVKNGRAELKNITQTSRTLASRIGSGKPASAEARQLMDSVQTVQMLVDSEGMPEQVVTAWEEGAANIRKISQAFDL